MALSDFIQIQISIDSIGIARAGFGIPLIPSANATFPERVRFYADIDAVAADWAAGTPERLAATNMFDQDNKPVLIAIGRCALKPTLQYTTVVATLANSTHYQARLRGPGVTDTTVNITSGSSATLASVTDQIVTAVNAVVGKNFTATFTPLVFADDTFTAATTDICTDVAHGLLTGDGPFQLTSSGTLPAGLSPATDYWIIRLDADTFKFTTSLAFALAGTPVVDISGTGSGTHTISDTVNTVSPAIGFHTTGNTAGAWFALEVLDSSGLPTSNAVAMLSNAITHADPGVATDYDAIAAESSAWYALYTLYNSKACILGTAAWTEGQPRIYVADTCDSACITTIAGNGDVMDTAKGLSYSRTLIEYHPSQYDFLGAALEGQVLPLDPGSETWAFKSNLSGVRGVNLTATHRVNLRAKNGNTYEPQTPDVTWTWDGKSADGEFIDTIRGLDFLRDDVTKSIATVLANNPKVPYTDGGVVTLANELEGAFARAVAAGILSDNPAPQFVVPRVATQSSANRRARKFAGLKGSGTLAGAVQDVGPVSIVITQ